MYSYSKSYTKRDPVKKEGLTYRYKKEGLTHTYKKEGEGVRREREQENERTREREIERERDEHWSRAVRERFDIGWSGMLPLVDCKWQTEFTLKMEPKWSLTALSESLSSSLAGQELG